MIKQQFEEKNNVPVIHILISRVTESNKLDKVYIGTEIKGESSKTGK